MVYLSAWETRGFIPVVLTLAILARYKQKAFSTDDDGRLRLAVFCHVFRRDDPPLTVTG
jgi:hypothetical protein